MIADWGNKRTSQIADFDFEGHFVLAKAEARSQLQSGGHLSLARLHLLTLLGVPVLAAVAATNLFLTHVFSKPELPYKELQSVFVLHHQNGAVLLLFIIVLHVVDLSDCKLRIIIVGVILEDVVLREAEGFAPIVFESYTYPSLGHLILLVSHFIFYDIGDSERVLLRRIFLVRMVTNVVNDNARVMRVVLGVANEGE